MKISPFYIVFFLLILLSLTTENSTAQITNTENQRIVTDTIGWSRSTGLSLSASSLRESYVVFNTNSHIQYKTEDDLYLGYIDYDIVNAGGTRFNTSGFGHIRYNRKVSEVTRLEVFTQLQYNSVKKIELRYLTGTGFRFKLTPYEDAKFYFGLAYMYEYERILVQLEINKNHRVSSYFTF